MSGLPFLARCSECVPTSLLVGTNAIYRMLKIPKSFNYMFGLKELIPASDVYFIRPLSIANAVLTGLYTITIALIYVTLLKFDVFFFLGFMIQLITIAVGNGDAEYAFTIAYIPFIVITLSVSTWFMRRENTTVSSPGIVCLLHFQICTHVPASPRCGLSACSKDPDIFWRITLLLSFLTIVVAVKCIANFTKGLKIHINSSGLVQGLLEDYEMEMSESRNLTSVQRDEYWTNNEGHQR
ncbi:hypothetical protein N431DRAFT_444589 [Stipitochalara longipes BDJ]|nr:hypothetical protein N431DRAFT_444589 [Stipitochalara longipes BDJ]